MLGPTKRIEWLDILKGIGILFVVWGHGLIKNPIIYGMVWSVHMPLFFYASGYTYTKRTFSQQIKQDIKGLLLPYGGGGIALWAANIISSFRHGEDFCILNTVLDYMGKILYGSGGYLLKLFDGKITFSAIGALWFVPALFCARIFLYFVLSLKPEYRLCTLAGIVYVGLRLTEILTVNRDIWLPFSVQAAMSGVLFMYFGVIVKEEKIIGRKIIFQEGLVYLLCGLVWAFVFTMGSGIGMVFNKFPNDTLDFIGALCGLVCMSQIAVLIEKHFKIIKGFLIFCGRNTMIFLVFHLIELNFINWYELFEWLGNMAEQTSVAMILGIKIVWCVIFAYIFGCIKNTYINDCIVNHKGEC